jgi:hypothetical protein
MCVKLSIWVVAFSLLVITPTAMAQSLNVPLSMTITAARPEVKSGAEVLVNVTLTNDSNRVVTLEFRSPLCDYSVEVRDSAGNLVPDTQLAKSLDCASASGRDIIVSLHPHEFFKDGIPVNAVRDISQAGEYSVQVMWKTPKEFDSGLVRSNTVKITVAP